MNVTVTYSPLEVIVLLVVVGFLGGFFWAAGTALYETWDIFRNDSKDE